MNNKPSEEWIGMRIPKELKQAATKQATNQGRTLSNYIKYLIIEDIKRNKPGD